MLQIFDVINDGKLIAVEISDGKETWFYAFDQARFPSLRIGKFPCRSSGGEYPRQFRIKYSDDHTITFAGGTSPRNPLPKEDLLNSPLHGGVRGGLQSYEEIGAQIGRLVTEKQAAYGDSFGKSGDVLRILYPDGIKPDQYDDALAIVRIIDKLFRITNNKDAFGESPFQDIAGYAILGMAKSPLGRGEGVGKPDINPSLKAVVWKDAHGL